MKKYFCDVCGAELEEGGNAPPYPASELCGLEDLCAGCAKLTETLDAPGLVLAELRRLAQRPPSPELVPVLSGRGAAEKRKILEALQAFRKENGAGAIVLLSRKCGVEEGILRDILQCHKVPLATWRKVAKALCVEERG